MILASVISALFQANLATAPMPSAPPHYAPPALAHFRPVWIRTPSAKAFAARYPRRAALARMDGRVILLCAIDAGGRLRDCQVLNETPAGWGFGAAALSLSDGFRIQPPMVDGHAMGGFKISIPLRFVAPPPAAPLKPVP